MSLLTWRVEKMSHEMCAQANSELTSCRRKGKRRRKRSAFEFAELNVDQTHFLYITAKVNRIDNILQGRISFTVVITAVRINCCHFKSSEEHRDVLERASMARHISGMFTEKLHLLWWYVCRHNLKVNDIQSHNVQYVITQKCISLSTNSTHFW